MTANPTTLTAVSDVAAKAVSIRRIHRSTSSDSAVIIRRKLRSRSVGIHTLVLGDVSATPQGIRRGVEYRLYLNLPRERGDQFRHDDFYLGSINSFALSHHRGQHSVRLTYDLTKLAPALSKYGLWTNAKVSVSMISDDDNTAQPLIRIGDIQLLVSDAPLL